MLLGPRVGLDFAGVVKQVGTGVKAGSGGGGIGRRRLALISTSTSLGEVRTGVAKFSSKENTPALPRVTAFMMAGRSSGAADAQASPDVLLGRAMTKASACVDRVSTLLRLSGAS